MFERQDVPGAWQFPQGGIDEGEEPISAAYRELEEETGLIKNNVMLIGEYPEWLIYELPESLRHKKPNMRGQAQRWFVFDLQGNENLINLSVNDYPEFSAYKWVKLSLIENIAVSFRKPIYRALARFIAHL